MKMRYLAFLAGAMIGVPEPAKALGEQGAVCYQSPALVEFELASRGTVLGPRPRVDSSSRSSAARVHGVADGQTKLASTHPSADHAGRQRLRKVRPFEAAAGPFPAEQRQRLVSDAVMPAPTDHRLATRPIVSEPRSLTLPLAEPFDPVSHSANPVPVESQA